MSQSSEITRACDAHDCQISPNRRRFLRDSFTAVAGAMVALGMTKKAALAMPLEFATATTSRKVGSLRSYSIPMGDGAQIDQDNQVILARWQNAVYAFNLSCPHQNTALKWDDGDHQFHCPKHHSLFKADGTFIEGRAKRGMDRFAIQRAGASVAIDLNKLYQQDENPTEWAAAVIRIA